MEIQSPPAATHNTPPRSDWQAMKQRAKISRFGCCIGINTYGQTGGCRKPVQLLRRGTPFAAYQWRLMPKKSPRGTQAAMTGKDPHEREWLEAATARSPPPRCDARDQEAARLIGRDTVTIRRANNRRVPWCAALQVMMPDAGTATRRASGRRPGNGSSAPSSDIFLDQCVSESMGGALLAPEASMASRIGRLRYKGAPAPRHAAYSASPGRQARGEDGQHQKPEFAAGRRSDDGAARVGNLEAAAAARTGRRVRARLRPLL